MSEVVTERFAVIAKKYDGLRATELGKAFVLATAAKEEAAAVKTLAEAEVEFLRVKLAESMEKEGLPKFTVHLDSPDDPDGIDKRIRVQEEINVSATQDSGAAERVISILKDTGNVGLIKETVAPATLKKFVGDLRKKNTEDGMPDPVLMKLIDAGMTVTARDMARFY